jgi:hypothetical protein
VLACTPDDDAAVLHNSIPVLLGQIGWAKAVVYECLVVKARAG